MLAGAPTCCRVHPIGEMIMANLDFDIADLPHLADVPAAHGALASQTQLGGPSLFDIIITVVVETGGK